MTEPVELFDDDHIDKLVPPKIMRLTQHLHNLIYIRFFYEQIGQQPPVWIKGEMGRAEQALIEGLEREEMQGGAFRKEIPCDKDEQVETDERAGRSSLSQRPLVRRV